MLYKSVNGQFNANINLKIKKLKKQFTLKNYNSVIFAHPQKPKPE